MTGIEFFKTVQGYSKDPTGETSKDKKIIEYLLSAERLLKLLKEAANQKTIIKKTAIYRKWYAGIRKKKDKELVRAIRKKLKQLRRGNFQGARPERGVFEMAIDYGPGYRLYFMANGKVVVILLCGGDKSTQDEDIKIANQIADSIKRRLK